MAETVEAMLEGIRRANFEVAIAVAERRQKEVLALCTDWRPARVKDSFPKRCGCCGKVHDEASWNRLPSLGYQGGKVPLEMRNCDGLGPNGEVCNSTLTVDVIL
jgi:hypothetical protein